MFGKEDQTLIRPWQAFQRDMALWNGNSRISSTENQRMVRSSLKSSKWPRSDLGEPRFALSLCWLRLGPQIFIDRGHKNHRKSVTKITLPSNDLGDRLFSARSWSIILSWHIWNRITNGQDIPIIFQSYSMILLPSGDLHVAMERGALLWMISSMKTMWIFHGKRVGEPIAARRTVPAGTPQRDEKHWVYPFGKPWWFTHQYVRTGGNLGILSEFYVDKWCCYLLCMFVGNDMGYDWMGISWELITTYNHQYVIWWFTWMLLLLPGPRQWWLVGG